MSLTPMVPRSESVSVFLDHSAFRNINRRRHRIEPRRLLARSLHIISNKIMQDSPSNDSIVNLDEIYEENVRPY